MLSQGNLAANARMLLEAWRITAADRYLAVLPLFHVHGLGNGICCWLASGCRMRLAERFEHDKSQALFDAFRPTLFYGVPTVYVRLLELEPDAARAIGVGVRLFVSGSAPLPAPVFESFRSCADRVCSPAIGGDPTPPPRLSPPTAFLGAATWPSARPTAT